MQTWLSDHAEYYVDPGEEVPQRLRVQAGGSLIRISLLGWKPIDS